MQSCSHLVSGNPVFVFGALRSGTTVFRLMLDAHPRIKNPGEADYLFDYLHQSDKGQWRYDLDALRADRIFNAQELKIPAGVDGLRLLEAFLRQLDEKAPGILTLNVHRNIQRLHAALPGTRLLHMLRDPRDVARSSIGMGWSGNSYHGVDHWIRTETQWSAVEKSVNPNNVLELHYEDLFADCPSTLKRVCEFLGVPFDPAMLTYHETSSYSPPDRSLVKQWTRNASQNEIVWIEHKAGALMRARGYETATPGTAPSLLRKVFLFLTNKLAVWKFGIRRYGASVFLLEKLTRWLRIGKLNHGYREIMQREDIKRLK
ncbi:sulfotransferase family protein [Roseovarius aestuariivivens]|uniref:sulfotransferase family protein n=1 Tax=Roseovarius aestuariivivens TaxID=1888910 RepID=UPI00247818EC|nr:sulfotransferase [Roseovarius aestuariivivens]